MLNTLPSILLFLIRVVHRSSVKADLDKSNQASTNQEVEGSRLKATVHSLESKCTRLRDYIRKLTKKCEEWEVSYERQAKSIEKLQGKNLKIREKATEFASRYHKLKGDIKKRKKVRRKSVIEFSVTLRFFLTYLFSFSKNSHTSMTEQSGQLSDQLFMKFMLN
jgi:cell division protein FtsB